MNEKGFLQSKKIWITLLSLSISISILSASLHYNDSKDSQNIHFLNVYGSINYVTDANNTMTLAFITKGTDFSRDVLTLDFSSNLVTASDISLTKSISYKSYTLWYLSFSVNIETENYSNEPIAIHSITFNGIEYSKIGDLCFNIVRDSAPLSSYLRLKYYAAASIGTKLSNYHATFENPNKYPIDILAVTVPFFDQAKVKIRIDSSEFISTEGVVSIPPSSTMDLEINLSGCSRPDINVYYVAPIVRYTYENVMYQSALDYYTSGLNISKEDLYNIGKQIQWDEQ